MPILRYCARHRVRYCLNYTEHALYPSTQAFQPVVRSATNVRNYNI